MIIWRMIKRIFSKMEKIIEEERSGKSGCKGIASKYPILVSHLKKVLSEIDKARSSYAWGVISGADLAKKLGIDRISVIEFGVAGGSGLVALEKIASKVEKIYGISIDVYGFDTAKGLPRPKDYRDLPHLWNESDFRMDKEKLQKRLKKARLVLGDVKDTIPGFMKSNPCPIAFMAFDVDMYSSTMDSFKLLEGKEDLFLPRVHCYFDDVMGFSFSEFNGERLAIDDFNKSHKMRKISRIYGLKYFVNCDQKWTEQMYLFHVFGHKLYGKNDGMVLTDTLPLNE